MMTKARQAHVLSYSSALLAFLIHFMDVNRIFTSRLREVGSGVIQLLNLSHIVLNL